MADVEHNEIQDPEIHEPKGVSSASSGEVYVADGLGSGDWTDYSTWTGYPAYGGMVLNDAASVSVTTIGTTAQKLVVFTANTASSGVVPDHSTDDDITVPVTGVYQVFFGITFGTAAVGDAGEYQFKLRVNGSEPSAPSNLGFRKDLSGTDDITNCCFQGLVSLTANDILTVWVESDEAGDTDDLSVYDAQFMVTLVEV